MSSEVGCGAADTALAQDAARVETWHTHSGEQALQCKLFASTDDAVLCGIMHEPTRAVTLESLPACWPGAPPANSAQLQCGHVFHPAALALHFLVADMRCPVCRDGFTQTMSLDSVPAELRACYEGRVKSIKRLEQETEVRVDASTSIAEVLGGLELQLGMFEGTREVTSVRTRIIFTEAQIEQIQQIQGQQRESESPMHCNFAVHRSFQRLVVGLVSRHSSQNPERRVRFALRHPLVPVSMASNECSVASMWSSLFNPAQQQPPEPVPFYCPHVTGQEPVAHLRVAFPHNGAVPSISVDVNIVFLMNIAVYVSDVLESVRVAVEQHVGAFDSPTVLEITQSAVNGLGLFHAPGA